MFGKFSSLVFALAASSSVLAHSWVDCVKYDPVNQLCLGYPRGYPGRQNVDINTLYTYMFEASPASQPMCSPQQQTTMNYAKEFPLAVAQPGETIYTTWQQNGHLDNAKPTKIEVYYYADHNKEFTDVSQRKEAKVAGTMDFATDGNCYIPGYPNTVCVGSWTVPKDLAPGQIYHFVWFWYFNANPAGQWYSTCFDVQVNSVSHVVKTIDMPAVLAKGNPNINYVWGVNDAVRGLLSNTTSLANQKGEVPPQPPVQPPPPPPVPRAPETTTTTTSSTTTTATTPTSATTPVIKCIPRPTPK
ncbi:hypothetical protein H4218_003858 [Coemansia sp. IMI 209128]|nr:hypothetical protein GGI06_003340 [Coemansia sp. S85]KAJ2697593.1 hypothetical protein H4218_003858 [Coemansia sp. IMI 209128]